MGALYCYQSLVLAFCVLSDLLFVMRDPRRIGLIGVLGAKRHHRPPLMTVALVQRRTRCVGGLARSRGIPPPAPTPRESAPLSRARIRPETSAQHARAQPLGSASASSAPCGGRA